MKNYVLNEDEVILLRGMVAQFYDWKEEKDANTYNTELLLTNLNIVLDKDDDITSRQVFNVTDIKIYDEKPQIIRRKSVIEIYHKSAEIYFKFEQEKSAKEFCDKALKLFSGNTKFVRSVKSAEKIIKDNTEPLGIDAKKLAKNSASMAYHAFSTYTDGGKKGVGIAVKAIAGAIKQKQNEALLTSAEDAED